MVVNKKQMSEAEICTKFITPSILRAGWKMDQIRQEWGFTEGRIIVHGKTVKRGPNKRADYVLFYNNNKIALIEAKDNNKSIGHGMQQGLDYAESLDIPFVYSSNGDGFIEHDRESAKERELSLNDFPSPKELWERYKTIHNIDDTEEEIITRDYYIEPGGKTPRYYQRVAIDRTIQAIAKGQKRILLVMATGTGKTFTAFQIIHRLRDGKKKPRILYLADRNVLIDQTMVNDFKSFKGIMTKVKKRKVKKAYEIYMALYQGLTGSEDWKNIYKQFSKDFFDVIIVDECHRGSAKADSVWREVLEYFSNSVQIGLTATPKETSEVSNIEYFGEPVYTYSLKQGIEDGFLAPYKVLRIGIDKDLEGWRPQKGKLDKYGNVIPDKVYKSKDYDKELVIDSRTQIVAEKVTEFLKKSDRFAKTIVFCVDIEHAERMRRALINLNSDLYKKNSKYILRITGDNEVGKKQLDNFIDPESKYPVIATTSKLMTTGVDAQTCKLIVLDSNIQSMTEFKQIIGRGSRIKEEYGKYFFTIMDFRNVTQLFADPDFDGEPVKVLELIHDEAINVNQIGVEYLKSPQPTERKEKRQKYYVSDVKSKVISEKQELLDPQGKLITESIIDYSKDLIKKKYSSAKEFIKIWKASENKKELVDDLINEGLYINELVKEIGEDYDFFDIILKVGFDKKPKTKSERIKELISKDFSSDYGKTGDKVIKALLNKFKEEGVENLEDPKVLKIKPFTEFGSPVQIIKSFGGKISYNKMIKKLIKEIYEA